MYIIVEGRVQERFELQHPAQPQSTKGEMLNATLPSFQSQSSIAATRLVELASVEGADATESMLQQDEALPGEPVSEKASCDCLGLRALTPSVCLGGAEPTYAVSCVARDDCVTLAIPRATFLAWLAQRNERDGAEDSVVNQMKVALKQSNVMGYEPHLAEVPDYAITQLCRLMSFSRFEVGELVLTRAKMQPMLVIVLSGMVTVKLRPSPSSRKAGMKLDKAGLLTMTVAAGRNFGLDWMLGVEKPDADLLVSAVAGARNTHLMTLDRPTFDAWVGKDAILQRHLVAGVHRVHSCTYAHLF
jgi:CRP-like cAMP-binding protein